MAGWIRVGGSVYPVEQCGLRDLGDGWVSVSWSSSPPVSVNASLAEAIAAVETAARTGTTVEIGSHRATAAVRDVAVDAERRGRLLGWRVVRDRRGEMLASAAKRLRDAEPDDRGLLVSVAGQLVLEIARIDFESVEVR